MKARPVIKAASGGVTRRLTQTVVIFLVLLISTAATLGMALLANSSGPFDRAFAAQHGAHVAATINSAWVTGAQLAATSKLPGVTGAAGPFPDVTLQMTQPAPPGAGNAGPPPLPPTTVPVIGRASPGGPARRGLGDRPGGHGRTASGARLPVTLPSTICTVRPA